MLSNFFTNSYSLLFQPTLKTLVTVTEMLSKHKQKYTEMISSSNNSSNVSTLQTQQSINWKNNNNIPGSFFSYEKQNRETINELLNFLCQWPIFEPTQETEEA